MNKEALLARRSLYVREREQQLANAQATSGAIQDIDHWLAELDKKENDNAKSDSAAVS